jgi:hypothetical protein
VVELFRQLDRRAGVTKAAEPRGRANGHNEYLFPPGGVFDSDRFHSIRAFAPVRHRYDLCCKESM